MEDVKAMARAKRASSRRGWARHSHNKHTHIAGAPAGGGPAVASGGAARDQNVVEEVLPSNWERYSDGDGGEDEAPPLDGEVRPKSKGADYLELLSSNGSKLYEDLPEPGGMWSMMLEPGLGLWDGDSWLEPPSASEQQVARDAAALLSLDLGLLGRSLARLHVAERIMVEKELFPNQETAVCRSVSDVKYAMILACVNGPVLEGSFNPINLGDECTIEGLSKTPMYWTEKNLQEGEQDNLAEAHSSAEIPNHEDTASSPGTNGGVKWTDRPGFATDAVISPVYGSSLKSPNSIAVLKGGGPSVRDDIVKQASRTDEKATSGTSAQLSGHRKFVPAAAEADLDALLDMLDNHIGQPPLSSRNLPNGTEVVSSPDVSFLSNLSVGGPQFLEIVSLPRKPNREPASVNENGYVEQTVARTDRTEEKKSSLKVDNGVSALSLDDDLDSWLDSI